MTGVVLAGGEGTRLRPATYAYNKHAAVVYDKPMIHYPIEALKEMGCDEVVIVAGPEGIGDLLKVVRNGEDVGVHILYRVQASEAGGTAEALSAAEGAVEGVFPVLCGDVYFDPVPPTSDVPALIYNEFEGANQHTVWNPETNELVEKPLKDMGKRAIVAYWFDEKVFDFIKTLKPSDKGEIEMLDIYKFYLENGASVIEHRGFFGDMGTPDGLLRVANYLRQKI